VVGLVCIIFLTNLGKLNFVESVGRFTNIEQRSTER